MRHSGSSFLQTRAPPTFQEPCLLSDVPVLPKTLVPHPPPPPGSCWVCGCVRTKSVLSQLPDAQLCHDSQENFPTKLQFCPIPPGQPDGRPRLQETPVLPARCRGLRGGGAHFMGADLPVPGAGLCNPVPWGSAHGCQTTARSPDSDVSRPQLRAAAPRPGQAGLKSRRDRPTPAVTPLPAGPHHLLQRQGSSTGACPPDSQPWMSVLGF